MLNSIVQAQAKDSIAGEYYLSGVMETASGFQLKPDSTFLFFYSYGVVDRYGSGKWSLKNNAILLDSKPKPGEDFRLIKTANVNDQFVTIKISDNNTNILSHIICVARDKNGERQAETNSQGIAKFTGQKIDSIWIIFEFCPEKISRFALDPAKNFFEFKFEPWIAEVFFEKFRLEWDPDGLIGGHPLLEGNKYHYEKNR